MLQFMQRFGGDSQARWRGTGWPGGRPGTEGRSRSTARAPRRNQRLNCEALEGRQMLSGFYIVNECSGKVLDDPDFSTAASTTHMSTTRWAPRPFGSPWSRRLTPRPTTRRAATRSNSSTRGAPRRTGGPRLTLPSNGDGVSFELKPLRQFHALAAVNPYYFSNFHCVLPHTKSGAHDPS